MVKVRRGRENFNQNDYSRENGEHDTRISGPAGCSECLTMDSMLGQWEGEMGGVAGWKGNWSENWSGNLHSILEHLYLVSSCYAKYSNPFEKI